jgi:DNA polymerase-3 subunit alpha (Gram-positive type)
MMVVPQGRDMTEFSPFQFPADDPNAGMRTTHFDYHAIHDTLCKLDILGHDDPTVLRKLGQLTGIDVRKLPFDDKETQSLFSSLDALGISREDAGGYDVGTIGVPEFGTGFVRRMLMETRPQTFSDLVRISGLSHGTDVWTNNAQELIAKGTATLAEVIPCRDDIMVYLMYRDMEPALAFRIMESVRRGRGLTDEWEAAMRAHSVPDWYIESCKKIKYMFPKAHAAAYVMMGFRIAWFKVHDPLAFYATYFSVRAGEFDAEIICRGQAAVQSHLQELERKGNEATAKEKSLFTILEAAREMMARGYSFQKVDVYKSDATDFQIDGTSLRPPLRTLSGLGGTAAQGVVTARADGEFTSLEDLRTRARLSKTVVELMQRHGAVPEDLPASNQLSLF